jgi:hypothetical protein
VRLRITVVKDEALPVKINRRETFHDGQKPANQTELCQRAESKTP